MTNQKNLSDPIALRLPADVLAQVEEIALACDRSRSWVIVRALKAYLAAEGQELLDLAKARRDVVAGRSHDIDDVIGEIEAIVKDAAA